MRKLPPLNGLRAFEAAARHLSFTAAADELNVTPAAIGHQIRALEDYFGQKLFDRSTRKVELTEAARWVLPQLSQGLDLLAEAGERLAASPGSPLLNLTVEPDFAVRWLVPKLDDFQQAHPQWEVRINATHQLIDLTRRDFDMGIRYGDGNYPGLVACKLGEEEVFPVCAPSLLQGDRAIREPNDLRWHSLIHEEWTMAMEQAWPSWKMWLKAAGADQVDPDRGTRFTSSNLVIEAAIKGQGVALSSTALIAHDLENGRLVRPFEARHGTPLQLGYYVVYRAALEREEKILAFRDWLLTSYCKAQYRVGSTAQDREPAPEIR